jgi:hypothetical protein
MITVLAVILAMVWMIDLLSDYLRGRILNARPSDALPSPRKVQMEESTHA